MDAFLARQPVFDRARKIFAYELLFRSGTENSFSGTDSNEATYRAMAESFLMPGAVSLTNGKLAFINITREVLLTELIYLIPPEIAAVELLENISPDDEVIQACLKLKKS